MIGNGAPPCARFDFSFCVGYAYWVFWPLRLSNGRLGCCWLEFSAIFSHLDLT